MHKTEISEGRQYHIRCKPGDLAKYLLVPGDPVRVLKLSSTGTLPLKFLIIGNLGLLMALTREFRFQLCQAASAQLV